MKKNENDYEAEFQTAIERTDSWGMCAPYFKPSAHRVAEAKSPELSAFMQEFLGSFSADDIYRQCFFVTLSMKKGIENILGTPLVYTLGYVQRHQRDYFYTPLPELKRHISHPLSGEGFNLHAWLTTPSYEIIDATFLTTWGKLKNEPDLIGRVFKQHYSALLQDVIYHPQITGEEYLRQIGGLIDF